MSEGYLMREEISQMERGSIVNPECEICFQQGWTCSYGIYLCRPCLRDFLSSIIHRSDHDCPRGERGCNAFTPIICRYCKLARGYRLGLKAYRFGAHEDGWYIMDEVDNLTKAEKNEPPNPDQILELRSLHKYYSDMTEMFLEWKADFPPPNRINQEKKYMERLTIKGMIMMIVADCFNNHDVLRMNGEFHDPYKCRTPIIQTLNIEILKLVRMFVKEYREKGIDLEVKKAVIYENPRRSTNVLVKHFQSQIITIVELYQTAAKIIDELLPSERRID